MRQVIAINEDQNFRFIIDDIYTTIGAMYHNLRPLTYLIYWLPIGTMAPICLIIVINTYHTSTTLPICYM